MTSTNIEYEVFTLKAPIAPKPRMTQKDKWLQPARPSVERYRAYKNSLQAALLQQTDFSPAHHDIVALEILLQIPFPKSYSKKLRKEAQGFLHSIRPDTSNIQKGIEDALMGEDSGIAIVSIAKIWGTTPITTIGIYYAEKAKRRFVAPLWGENEPPMPFSRI